MNTETNGIPSQAAVDIVIEVLSEALDKMHPVTIDVDHITGAGEPKVDLSLTSNWGSPDNLHLTLWHEDPEEVGPLEVGTFAVNIRRVI